MRPSPIATLQLSARRFASRLAVVAGVLILANIGVLYVRFGLGHPRFFGINRLFDLDEEANVPSLFSTALFFANSALLFLVAKADAHHKNSAHRSCWWLLASLFLFLGIDENVSIHEQFVGIIRDHLKVGGIFYFAWVIPYGIATLVGASLLIPWFWKLDRSTQWRFAASAIIFVSGAMGMEMLGGRYLESLAGKKDLTYYLFAMIEEMLEMTGLIVFAHSLLHILERYRGTSVLLTIGSKASPNIGVETGGENSESFSTAQRIANKD